MNRLNTCSLIFEVVQIQRQLDLAVMKLSRLLTHLEQMSGYIEERLVAYYNSQRLAAYLQHGA